MNYDFSLIKIIQHSAGGPLALDPREFFKKYPELEELTKAPDGARPPFPPEGFSQELDRLSAMPYSADVADKLREVIKKGFARAKQGEPTHFAVHSMVRSRFNRTQRAQAPQHARFKQHVGSEQRRLLRNRPMLITEEVLKRDRDELLEMQKTGILEVRTLDGRLLDLETLQIGPAAPAENPRSSPVLDSVANDIPTGIPFPKIPGGTVLSTDQVRQVVEGMTDVDGELKIDPKDGTVVVVPLEEKDMPLPGALSEEEEELEELEEVEELPPGVPPPPPPPGGVPPRPQNTKKNKKPR